MRGASSVGFSEELHLAADLYGSNVDADLLTVGFALVACPRVARAYQLEPAKDADCSDSRQ
jgi:hypothetical protein